MRFEILGPLRITDGEQGAPVVVSAARLRALLVALLLRANHPVPVDELAEVVWDGVPPAGAMTSVRAYVMRLRRALGVEASRIVTCDPGYLIRLDESELDLLRFEALCRNVGDAARALDWVDVSATAVAALGLWRAPPLIDVPVQALRDRWLPRLERLRLRTIEWRIDADLHLGRHDELVSELMELTSQHPLQEHFHAQLMLALARCGRRAEALTVYRDARQSLVAELGIEPGPELRELQERILSGTIEPAVSDVVERSRSGREPVPRQLPAATPHFTGRQDELDALSGLLDRRAAGGGTVVISAIDGSAGIGKTALAVHWGQHFGDRFPDGQLYVNLRGFVEDGPPVPPALAVRGFLDALGVPVERVPVDLEAQVGLYRSLVAGKRILVVLDNARDADQVRPLLPGGSTCMTLVTSRDQLSGLVAVEGAQPLTLDLLTSDEARELLERRLGAERVRAEPEAVGELVELCSRLPLALNIAAARATLRPHYPLAVLAEELRDAHARLAGLDTGDVSASVRAVFSWSYRILEPATAGMFRLLAAHPGPDISVPVAASLAATSRDQARGALQELTRVHLLTEHKPGRYTFHDLLRAYAIEQAHAQDTDHERHQALHRVLDHYLHTSYRAVLRLHPARDRVTPVSPQPGVQPEDLTEDAQAWAWLDAEHEVLLRAVDRAADARFDTHAWQLPWNLVTYLDRRGYWQDYVTTQLTALGAAERLGDAASQARAHRSLGGAYIRLGLYAEAHASLYRALYLYEELDDHVGQGHSHYPLAWMRQQQGRNHEALDHAQQALELYRKSGYRQGEALALNAIGYLYSLLGEHDQALTGCRQAVQLNHDLGNPLGEAHAWDSLGHAHHHLGHYADALACYEHALGRYQQTGDGYNKATALDHLGDTYLSAGDKQAARAAWHRALAILDDLQHSDAQEVRAKLLHLSAAGLELLP